MKTIAGLQNVPFLVGDGAKTSALAKNIKPLGGGAVYGSIPGADPAQNPKFQDFYNAYTKAYGADQYGAYSAGGYDDANILLQAIKIAIQQKNAVAPKDSNDSSTATTFRQAVIDALKSSSFSYDGVTGHVTFDQNGDTVSHIVSIYTLGDLTKADGWKYLSQIDASK
jgi:branched-chain amino acid transport system substrate-binding protein